MSFSLGNGIWDSVFAVPDQIVDAHIKMASGLSIKVLLILLRNNGKISLPEIAAQLGYSTDDVGDALRYWIQNQVVLSGQEEMRVQPVLAYEELPEKPPAVVKTEEKAAEPAGPPDAVEKSRTEQKIETIGNGRRRFSTHEINEMAEQDENIAHLLQEAQAVFGKTLTPVSTDAIVALYSYYGMQPDLILMLIHYCVSIGKDSMRYIEKVAADWLDKGIDTHEKADTELSRLMGKSTVEGKVKSAFGIYDRSLITSEKAYIEKWTEEYGQSIELITLAFERTVEVKGKLSFPYINGILTNWYGKGIQTPAQAMQEFRTKGQPPKGVQLDKASYDIGELEKMIAMGDIG